MFKNAVSFERPDRNLIESSLFAETLVQHLESKSQFQFSPNYDVQTAQQHASFLVVGARDWEREHQKDVTRNKERLGTNEVSNRVKMAVCKRSKVA